MDDESLLLRLRRRLAGYRPRRAWYSAARPAAVLVPVYLVDGQEHLVLIRRTDQVEAHRGQIAFPGGTVDPSDAGPAATALRESREEIGLDPRDVELLGVLDDHITGTGYRITPVVGLVTRTPYPFLPNPAEVAELFWVPLGWLVDPAHRSTRLLWREGEPITDYVWEYRGRVIWGATGRILHRLVCLLEDDQPA